MLFWNKTYAKEDYEYQGVLPEELMRRAPGLTRREADHIRKMGLNPEE